MRKHFLTAGLIGLACLSQAAAGEKLTYVDLVHRLTDLDRLAVLPEPLEQSDQWSSYDRASRYDDQTGKYVRWDANGDGTGHIRVEGDQEVFAEMTGPGCIWRIWSARPEAGRVKVYLDGAETPAIDLPFIGYFDRTNAPFIYPSLVHMTAKGQNCYVPIPYRKSCKIVASKGWGRYFLIDYATYPPGTEVPTFTRDLSPEETTALKAADEFLGNRLGTDPAKRDGEVDEVKRLTVPAGRAVEAASLAGPRAITALRVKVDLAALADRAEQVAALRELVLRITWDGEKNPAVWCPLGDFFGSAPGVNKYKSLPLGMTDEGFYCLWYMPFSTSAKVELVNDGGKDRALTVQLTHAPLARPVEQLGRFHAKWHRDAFLPAEPERAIDWTLLKVAGRGRFCGTMLHVWNPKGRWWGEGDEKFFVDGEKFPSWIGTGSEDYFGYAWCCPELFQNAYHNQTISMGNRGHVSVNRWHITDNVPFQTSFEGCIEKYFKNERPTLYAGTVYWYQAPGGSDPYGPVPLDQRVGYFDIEPKIPATVQGAIEGESLKPQAVTGGQIRGQAMSGWGEGVWSGEAQLWWTGAKPGNRLILPLRVATPGRYELKLRLTKAVDYGIVQLSLDETKLGEPIDLYNDGVAAADELSLGTYDLTAGPHKLIVEITGANPKAKKAYMFGLDYVRLVSK